MQQHGWCVRVESRTTLLAAVPGTHHLAVPAYRSQHGLAPLYLANELHRVADAYSHQRLLSTSTAALLVPRTRLSMVGNRAFPVAAARELSDFPSSVTSAPTLSNFKRRLKTAFSSCYEEDWHFQLMRWTYDRAVHLLNLHLKLFISMSS